MKKKGLRPISNQSNIKRWNWNNSFLKKKKPKTKSISVNLWNQYL